MNKNIVVFLGHPAHFHLFKNVVVNLKNDGCHVLCLIKRKDILENLIQEVNFDYRIVRSKERKGSSRINLIYSMFKMDLEVFKGIVRYKSDMLIGTYCPFISHISGIPFVSCNEDDANVVPRFAKLSYPFASAILNPIVCNSGKWNDKSIKYDSYHELAYLHPNHFTPDINVVEKYFNPRKKFFIIRFAKLTAHHDNGIKGISKDIAITLIEKLKPHGDIYITSERELEPQFEQYRIQINPLDMHHVMAFAQLYIGDSQTMAAESGVLGVPFVRFNDFVGKIGYLRELEDVYQLGFGIKTDEVERLYKVVDELLAMPNRVEVFQERRQKMLSEKIDYAKFLTWFIENYPESKRIMKENPDYQYRFR